MRKKGSVHVEIIISFILFASAVGFALYYFSPTSDRLIDSSFSYLFREISLNTSVNVETFSVKVNDPGLDTGNVLNVELETSEENNMLHSRVENSNGAVLPSRFVSESEGLGRVYASSAPFWSGEDSYFYIMLSEDYEDHENASLISSPEHNSSFYALSFSNNRELVSEKRLVELKKYYDFNYDLLKKEFNIPNRVNWGFEVVFMNSTIVAERNIPQNIEVFSEMKRLEILRDNGEIVFADLTVTVW